MLDPINIPLLRAPQAPRNEQTYEYFDGGKIAVDWCVVMVTRWKLGRVFICPCCCQCVYRGYLRELLLNVRMSGHWLCNYLTDFSPSRYATQNRFETSSRQSGAYALLSGRSSFLGECRRGPRHFWCCRACLRTHPAKRGLVPHSSGW